jgi:mannosyl-oligosaccharide alpha-1,2-mannosidase
MYLLFSPNDLLPLDQIVLNTEAHPFPRFDASHKRFKTGWERIPRDEKGNLVPKEADKPVDTKVDGKTT